ncbi:guanitoxin biosynthesis MBL fold metallo-hydrolase GntH [Rhodospirillum sp. A1_3_36]|uniref:guanitoxin biosynthesis MBL fold metallo-hydrolase GntH n=1 Tax=Rhodospirillum sp. A1_3_36 TaxID=3391666 RepID=UPI0039A5A197
MTNGESTQDTATSTEGSTTGSTTSSTTNSTTNSTTGATSSTSSSSSSGSSPAYTGVTPLATEIAQPAVYKYPGEALGPDEMRVTLAGSGMGNMVRRTQADCSIFVELGNGDSFVFDLGIGSLVNYQTMMIPFSRMTNIFISHLHMDHMNDLPGLYAFGPSGGRYQPLRVFGPSGQTPDLGLRHSIEGMKQFCRWHTTSFATAQAIDGSYDIEVNELDFRANPGIAYQENGVTITHWPALHVIDGAISYRLDWNGLSFVWSGDTEPNHFLVKHAAGADILVHETFPTLRRWDTVFPGTTQGYLGNLSTSHTSALCYGKVLSLTKPRMAVTNHCVSDDQEWTDIVTDIRVNWPGPYQLGSDFMVFNVSKDAIVTRKAAINDQSWGSNIGQATSSTAPLNSADFRSPAIFDAALTDCGGPAGGMSSDTSQS